MRFAAASRAGGAIPPLVQRILLSRIMMPRQNAWSQRIRNPISFDISLLLLTLNFAYENRLPAAAGGDMCVRKGRF